MNVTAQKLQSQNGLVRKSSARSNHRTTLPQSRPLGVTAPSEREPGGLAPFNVPPGNRNVAGDFHRPYETQKTLHCTIQRRTLPQSRPLGVPAPSEREPGGLAPFNVPPGNRNVAGDFHRPYETLMIWNFSIQRGHTMPRGTEPLHFAIHNVTKVTQNPTYRVRGHRRCQYGGWANYRAVLPSG